MNWLQENDKLTTCVHSAPYQRSASEDWILQPDGDGSNRTASSNALVEILLPAQRSDYRCESRFHHHYERSKSHYW